MSVKILQEAGKRDLLMGNEAIARGAIEAGVQLMAAYPGTPSTEIGEALFEAAPESDFYVEWSVNEKIAFEVAAGASFVGARTMVAMKNAGLNVAMDTFMTIPYGGIKGGMVVVVADDPDAHYSSNEQDTRFAASYAEIPCLEPENQQEAKDMAKDAFALSEEVGLPVFLRSVSRISHASGDVRFDPCEKNRNNLAFNKHYKLPYRWNVYGPPGAISKHAWLHEVLLQVQALANKSPYNSTFKPEGAKTGIIASGLAAAYAREALARLGMSDEVAFLKLGFIYPLPDEVVSSFFDGLDQVIMIEEGDPVVENMVRSLAKEVAPLAKISGKSFNPIFKPYGELNTDIVTDALAKVFDKELIGDSKEDVRKKKQSLIIPRSSTLCAGCSHLGSYAALKKALTHYSEEEVHIINGDIGCYEQGGYGIFASGNLANDADSMAYKPDSPYDMLDTIYVMGSGISMAHGQNKVGYKDGKVVAVCGDSTFFHGILPALMNIVYNQSDITFLILDNRWTCMTGHQPNPNTGYDVYGNECPRAEIPSIVKAMGIKSVRVADAYDQEEAVVAISEALDYKGPAVVILEGECQLQKQRRVKKSLAKTYISVNECDGCKSCVQLGCPAIMFDSKEKKSRIDNVLCVDCGLCIQNCPNDAIKMRRR